MFAALCVPLPEQALEAERRAEQVAGESLGALGIRVVDGEGVVDRESCNLLGEPHFNSLV